MFFLEAYEVYMRLSGAKGWTDRWGTQGRTNEAIMTPEYLSWIDGVALNTAATTARPAKAPMAAQTEARRLPTSSAKPLA